LKAKELEILKVLEIKVGAYTNPMEFLENYINQILSHSKDKEFISMMALYLSKMAVHHTLFCTLKPSMISACAIYVAFKICE
jgi:hypothetical protein